MKMIFTLCMSLLTVSLLTLSVVGDAEARRMGGGKSFGGKSSYSQAAPAPTQRQLTDSRQNATQRSAFSQRGGMMGILGGLALGGLLGALFFGGAFENINFLDILIFGLIAFLLYKWYAHTKRATVMQPRNTEGPAALLQARPHQAFDTDLMFKKQGADTLRNPSAAGTSTYTDTILLKDFNAEDFLEGAKLAYRRLQKSWDEGDLADIRLFTSDAVFAEIQDQLRPRQGENRTELLKVDAELLEVRESGPNSEASVLFDSIMREIDSDGSDDDRPEQRREIWHFTRPTDSKQTTWYLDGIQQVEG